MGPTPIVRSVNGYLCLNQAEVALARRGVDPAPRPAPAAPPPAPRSLVDLRA